MPLDPTKLYKVKLVCKIRKDTSNLVSDGLVVKQSTFVSHALWMSNSAGAGSVPPDAAKVVNIFAFQKDSTGAVVEFENLLCDETFLLSGKDSVLTVSFSLTKVASTSTFATIVTGAAKMVAGIAPAIFAGPLGSAVTTAATAAGSPNDPLKTMISAINNDPQKVAVPTRLVASERPIVIDTYYSHVEMTVTEVTDATPLILSDPQLKLSFYNAFDTISQTELSGTTAATAPPKCGAFFDKLGTKYSFSNDRKCARESGATAAGCDDQDLRLPELILRQPAALITPRSIWERGLVSDRKVTKSRIRTRATWSP